MIAGVYSAVTQVKEVVQELEAIHFRLLGVQAYLPRDPAELDRDSETDAMDPATRLRDAIACVLRDSLGPAIRDLEAAVQQAVQP